MDLLNSVDLDTNTRYNLLIRNLWNNVFGSDDYIREINGIIIFYLKSMDDGFFIGPDKLQSMEMLNENNIEINTQQRQAWTPEPPRFLTFDGQLESFHGPDQFNKNLIQAIRSPDFSLSPFEEKICEKADEKNAFDYNYEKNRIRSSMNKYGYSVNTPMKMKYILKTNFHLRKCWHHKLHLKHLGSMRRHSGRISTLFFSHFVIDEILNEPNVKSFKMNINIKQKAFLGQPFLGAGIAAMPLSQYYKDKKLEYFDAVKNTSNKIVEKLHENVMPPYIFSAYTAGSVPLREVRLITFDHGFNVSPIIERCAPPDKKFFFHFERGDQINVQVFKDNEGYICELDVNNNDKLKATGKLFNSIVGDRIILPYVTFESVMKDKNNNIKNILKLHVSFE